MGVEDLLDALAERAPVVALIVVAMIMSALAYSKLPPVAGRRLGEDCSSPSLPAA